MFQVTEAVENKETRNGNGHDCFIMNGLKGLAISKQFYDYTPKKISTWKQRLSHIFVLYGNF